MSLNNYCAIQAINRPALAVKWKKARINIAALETYINTIIDPLRGQDDSIVVIPRFNGGYISLRFCGLEIFQIKPAGEIQVTLGKTGAKIYKLDNPEPPVADVPALPAEVRSMLAEICAFLQHYSMKPGDGPTRALIEGFQPEHWLESVIMADNQLGVQSRARLGLNLSLAKCVTQAPATPIPGKKKSRPIDILSVLEDGRVKFVELKINADVSKANEELTSYKQWLTGRDYPAKYLPETRWEEGYLPARSEGAAGGGWRELLTPDCLVVATVRSDDYPTVLLKKEFINHLPAPFVDISPQS